MNRKPRHATLAIATLRPEMPSLRRMPAPSRLPEFDLDSVQTPPAVQPRQGGLMRAVLAGIAALKR